MPQHNESDQELMLQKTLHIAKCNGHFLQMALFSAITAHLAQHKHFCMTINYSTLI